MFFNHESDQAQAYAQVAGEPHKAKLSHELIAGAASYEAAKAYEHHLEREGKPVNHEKALEFLSAASGAFVDRMIETHGLDAFDRERLKHDARKQAARGLEQSGQY